MGSFLFPVGATPGFPPPKNLFSMATKRTFIERSYLRPWTGGPVKDWTTSARLFTGRPPSASKAIAESLMQFLGRYAIPLRAFSRHTWIAGEAIRQARVSKRSLSPRQETLIKATMERMQAGKIWLRRVTRQRWDLEWINPPYKPSCAMKLSHCHGGLLPGSCPRRWKECILNGKDWETIEEIHKANAEEKRISP